DHEQGAQGGLRDGARLPKGPHGSPLRLRATARARFQTQPFGDVLFPGELIMSRTMSDKGVAALKPRAKTYTQSDPELRGHWVRVQPSGKKTFVAITRDPRGKQLWTTIGPADAMTIEAAREQARSILTRVRTGLPALEPKAETVGTVLDNWLKRHI